MTEGDSNGDTGAEGLKENKSKYEFLEDKNSNFDDFGSKLDKFPTHVINRLVPNKWQTFWQRTVTKMFWSFTCLKSAHGTFHKQ